METVCEVKNFNFTALYKQEKELLVYDTAGTNKHKKQEKMHLQDPRHAPTIPVICNVASW